MFESSKLAHVLSFFPAMAALRVAALVEDGHWFVGRPRLELQEVGLAVETLWTRFVCGVHVLPSGRSSQHIVHLFQLGELVGRDLSFHVLHVGARVAGEAVAAGTLLHRQQVAARGTEQVHPAWWAFIRAKQDS